MCIFPLIHISPPEHTTTHSLRERAEVSVIQAPTPSQARPMRGMREACHSGHKQRKSVYVNKYRTMMRHPMSRAKKPNRRESERLFREAYIPCAFPSRYTNATRW